MYVAAVYLYTFIKGSEAWSPQTGVFSKREVHRQLRWLHIHQGLPTPLSDCSHLLHSAKTADNRILEAIPSGEDAQHIWKL